MVMLTIISISGLYSCMRIYNEMKVTGTISVNVGMFGI